MIMITITIIVIIIIIIITITFKVIFSTSKLETTKGGRHPKINVIKVRLRMSDRD